MQEILTRAGYLVAIIVLGYALRKIGVFRQEDFSVLSKIVMKITLPAAIIISFAGKEIDPAMLAVALVGLVCGLLYISLGILINRRNSRQQKAFEIVNLPGYNIGNFTLPFVQSFLGSTGVIVTSIFDTGNAMVGLGGAYGVAAMVKDGSGFSFRRIGRALMKSVPFLTYILMVAMCLMHIPIPAVVVSWAEIIAGGNAFLAMLMIGVGFKLEGDKSQIGYIVRIISIRYAVAVVLALCCYFCLPFSLEIRKTLTILMFSPIVSVAPAFTGELGGDVGLSSAINSASIIVSIVTTISLLVIMQ